jgi:hypothetical protein
MLPIETWFQIFEEILLFRKKSINNNILKTSRLFNHVLTNLIKNKFEKKFNINITIDKSIYRSIINRSIIQYMRLEDEEEMSNRKRAKKNPPKKINSLTIDQKKSNIFDFITDFSLEYKFIIKLDYLNYGKRMHRKFMVKNHEISSTDLRNGACHAANKFQKFHKINKHTFNCRYNPYSITFT